MTALETLLALDPCRKASAPIFTLLSMADAQTGTIYGTFRTQAVALLTLHWLALQERGRGAAPGAITAESEGDLSRSYAAVASANGSDVSLSSTSWGLELKRVRRAAYLAGGMRTRMDTEGDG